MKDIKIVQMYYKFALFKKLYSYTRRDKFYILQGELSCPSILSPPQGVDQNTYAQQYASQNGISLEQAKNELRSKFGDPQSQKLQLTSILIQFSP